MRDANDDWKCSAPSTSPCANTGRPTLIIVESHIGYGAPHKQDTAEAHGEPLGEEEVATPSGSSAGRKMRSSSCRTGCRSTSPTASASAAPRSTREWHALFARYRKSYPDLRRSSMRCSRANCRRGGTGTPDLPGRCQGHCQPRFLGQGENAIAEHLPWLIGGSADLTPCTKTRLTFKEAGDFQPDDARGRNMHFGVREHAMGAVVNGMALRQAAAVRLGLPDLHRLHAQPDPALAPSCSCRCSTSSRTIRSASARMGRRTSRSSSSSRCGRCPGWSCCGRAMRTRWRRLAHGAAAEAPARVPILSRQPLPTLDRSRFAPPRGWRAAPMCWLISAGDAARDPDRHGQRGFALHRRPPNSSPPGASRRESSACPPGSSSSSRTRLPGAGAADAIAARVAVEQAATLGWARYAGGTGDRGDAHLRRVGAAQGVAHQVRLHAGTRRDGRPGTDRQASRLRVGAAMVRDTHVEDAALSQALETNPAGPCAMMIFGAGGDLTKRPAAPALYNPAPGKLLPEQFGSAHRGLARPPDAVVGFLRLRACLRPAPPWRIKLRTREGRVGVASGRAMRSGGWSPRAWRVFVEGGPCVRSASRSARPKSIPIC